MKNIRRILAAILASVAVLSAMAFTSSAADTADITVKTEEKTVTFPDQKPVIRDDRTLVPIRFIAESLGYDVSWNEKDNTAVIDGGKIVLFIGTDKALIGGKETRLDTKSTVIGDRTMVPLRIVAETLGCTVDWFATNRTVLVNRRNADGSEKSVFDRFRQSGLFCYSRSSQDEYLVWKDGYRNESEAMSSRKWWIERPLDRTCLVSDGFDCSIIMKSFTGPELAAVKDLLFTVYPAKYDEAYGIMLKTIKGELWQTFYEEYSESYPLFSAMAPRSGTFGTVYLDDREVEMYMNAYGSELTVNISAEGHRNPDVPRTLSGEEITAYTEQAKKNYLTGRWGLD